MLRNASGTMRVLEERCNGAEDFEGIQKQRSTQESHAVGTTCRRRAKIKMKDSISIYVALASSKREMNLLAEARWCCERMGRGAAAAAGKPGDAATSHGQRVSNSQKMMMMMTIY